MWNNTNREVVDPARYMEFLAAARSDNKMVPKLRRVIFVEGSYVLKSTRSTLVSRVADPVHFRPDPDPANQNFKIGSESRILLALKESIKTSKFFHIKHISSDI